MWSLQNLKNFVIFHTLPFHRLCPAHALGCSVGFGWSVNANQRLEGLLWLIVWRYAEFAKSQKFSYFLHSPVSSFVSCPCFRLLDRLWMVHERKPKARGVDVIDRMKVCGVCKISKILLFFYTLPFHRLCPAHALGCSVGIGWSVNANQRLEGLMWLIVWRYAEFAKSKKFIYFLHSPVSSFVSCTCFRLLGRLWMVREHKPKARGLAVTDRMKVCGVCKITKM